MVPGVVGVARRFPRLFIAMTGVLGLMAGPVLAATPPVLDTGGTAWVIVASALVLFMTVPGLALFYGGLVRARNLLSVLMHCFVIACVVSLLWMAFGYSLVFDSGNPFIGSLDSAFLSGIRTRLQSNGLPEGAVALFQMTFAIITRR
jgi:Amt family ammonium transporter